MKTWKITTAIIIAIIWMANILFVCNEWYAQGCNLWSLFACVVYYTMFWWGVVYFGTYTIIKDKEKENV